MEGESLLVIIQIALTFGLPVLLLAVAMFSGRYLEKRHFKSIRERESQFASLPTVPTQSWDDSEVVVNSRLVSGSVVVSLDHFKKLLANLRNIFGGNVRAYESLLDRAKREAILRMKEQAPDADIVVNLRVVTSNIASIHDPRSKTVGGVEVIAFGTAIWYGKNEAPIPTQPSLT